RAARFHFAEHRDAYIVAHGMLRRILGSYAPGELHFVTGEYGKPALRDDVDVRFNLSHSGDLALVAVARGRDVGVDVERWNANIEHVALADYVFSIAERAALRELSESERVAGFFAAWSRKEAYIKATGHGITRGLDHFDVTLRPGESACILDDRMDPMFREGWVMRDVPVPDGYSAALVAGAPLRDVQHYDAE
ncbi:MAG: 4'-phosphopantetheinyl transferase superfamily protein, partial [bacterium]